MTISHVECLRGTEDEGPSTTKPNEKGGRVMLPARAMGLLIAWYKAHIHQPYVSTLELNMLAKEARITPSQTRKWLSNKRACTGNTLKKNGQMHPIQMVKLQEIQLAENSEDQQSTG